MTACPARPLAHAISDAGGGRRRRRGGKGAKLKLMRSWRKARARKWLRHVQECNFCQALIEFFQTCQKRGLPSNWARTPNTSAEHECFCQARCAARVRLQPTQHRLVDLLLWSGDLRSRGVPSGETGQTGLPASSFLFGCSHSYVCPTHCVTSAKITRKTRDSCGHRYAAAFNQFS